MKTPRILNYFKRRLIVIVNGKLGGLPLLFFLGVFFSCTPQSNCDTVFIEDPVTQQEIAGYKVDLSRLTNELLVANGLIKSKDDKIAELQSVVVAKDNAISGLQTEVLGLNTTVAEKDAEISSISATLDKTKADLADCIAKPVGTDTIYVDKPLDYITVAGVQYKVSDIQLIRPFKDIDTVVVTHCDSTKYTKWIHHGGISGYPHYISFSTKEYALVKVLFTDSLTNEIKVQPEYTLKRIKDYEKAETYFEFIK